MHTTLRCARRIYPEHHQGGWDAVGALFYARRGYTDRASAYSPEVKGAIRAVASLNRRIRNVEKHQRSA